MGRLITIQQVQGALSRAGIPSWNDASRADAKPGTEILLHRAGTYIHFQGLSADCHERNRQEEAAAGALRAEFGDEAVYVSYPTLYVRGLSFTTGGTRR